jgi:translocation and assembly module TamB
MRRAARILAALLVAALMLTSAAVGALLVTAHTAAGRRLIERWTPRLTGGLVRISGLAGSLPDDIELGTVDLSDDRGVWLSAEHVSLRWSALDLIAWRVHVDRLEVARLRVLRPPEAPPHAGAVQPSGGGGPSLPRIDVGRLSVAALVLEPAIAGSRATLSVSGSAHLESLDEATARFSARRTNGEGDYQLDLRFDRAGMNATLRLEEPASGPLEHLVQLPGLGALSLEASLAGPRNAESVRLDARVGTLAAHVQGTVNLPRRAADLTYSIESPAIAPRANLSWKRLSVAGRWSGSLDAPSGASRVRVDGLELPGGTRLASLAGNLTAASGAIELRVTAGGLVLPGPAPRLFAQSPVRLDATLHVNEPRRPLEITVRHRLVSLTAQALTSATHGATFDVRIPDIAPFAALARLQVTGGMTAQGTIDANGSAMRLELSATGGLTGRGMLAKLLAGASRVRLSAGWTHDTLDVARLEVSGGTMSLSGSGSARAASGAPSTGWQIERARWQLELPHLSAISSALRGALAMTGEASGPLASLATQIQTNSTLSVHGSPQETIDAVLQTRGLPPNLTGTLQAHGLLDGSPLALDASLMRDAGRRRHLFVRRATWKSVHVDADVTAGPRLSLASGKLDLRIDRLADLQPLLGRALEGRLSGSTTFTTSGASTLARVRIEALDVASAGMSGADVRLSGAGPLQALPLTLAVRIPNLAGGPASLDASLQASLPDRALALERIAAQYRGATLKLLSPARLSLAGGLRMSKVRLGVERAVLELEGEVAPALDLRASLHELDAKVIDVFEPNRLASGTIDAAAHLTGWLQAPRGRVTVTVHGLRMAASAAQDLPPIDATAAARLSGTDAQINAQLGAGRTSRITVDGRVPLNAAGHYGLKVSGSLDVALANPLLEAHGERASGTLAVDATVTGPASDPEIGGALELTRGDLRDYAEGLHFGDITARIVGGRGILRVASLSARAGRGTVSMRGTLGVLEPHMPVDLKLSAKNAEPIQSDLLTADLDADIRVEGTLRQRIDVTGSIHVNRAQIGIPNSLPPNVAVLDVRWPGEAPPQPAARRLAIGLDLAFDAPRGIIVQGRGLDAELGGSLKIGGTTQDPQVRGGFRMIMGTFSLASTQLRFSSGGVTFTGAGLKHQIDPSLDFLAQATVANATVTLRITGFADAPKFELSSSPKLPQDEILARLLFGESASQLSTLQVAQIGAALASLSGVGGGNTLNPLARVQKALGLAQLTVASATTTAAKGTTQSSGASITAGRYVSNRVFVAATQNTTGTSQLKVDVDLTKHLKLQTRIGNGTATAQGTTPENDPGSSVGLSYQFDY